MKLQALLLSLIITTGAAMAQGGFTHAVIKTSDLHVVTKEDFAQLQKKNQWLLDRLIDAEKLAWHFARKIDSTHAECVIADARLEMMSAKPVNSKSEGEN